MSCLCSSVIALEAHLGSPSDRQIDRQTDNQTDRRDGALDRRRRTTNRDITQERDISRKNSDCAKRIRRLTVGRSRSSDVLKAIYTVPGTRPFCAARISEQHPMRYFSVESRNFVCECQNGNSRKLCAIFQGRNVRKSFSAEIRADHAVGPNNVPQMALRVSLSGTLSFCSGYRSQLGSQCRHRLRVLFVEVEQH